MRRLDIHALEPGAYGQVPVTRLGEVVWETLDLTGAGGPMEVIGVSEAYHDSRPTDGYTVPIPAEVDPTFDGRFVLVINWKTGGIASLGGFENFDPSWTQVAYSGNGTSAIGIFGSTPREGDEVVIDYGSGPCHLTLIAVGEARGYRGLPLAATRLISDAETTTGWTTSGPHPVEQVTGPPSNYGDTTRVQVRPDYLGDNMAELVWSPAGGTDLTNHSQIEVKWGYAGDLGVDAAFEVYSGGQRLEWMGGVQDAYFATGVYTVPDGVVGDLTFRYGPFWEDNPNNRLRIEKVTALPFTNADYDLHTDVDLTATLRHGVDVVDGDLAIVVSADQSTGSKTHTIDTPGAVLLVQRQADVEWLNTWIWAVPVTADGEIRPTTTIAPFGSTISQAVAVLRNTGAGASGVSMTLDGLEDVQTGGAADRDVLTFDGEKWVALSPDAGADLLADLGDVDLTGLTAGQLILWDGTKWIPADPPAGTGTINLADLGDVGPTAPTTGQALVFDGTEWKPASVGGLDAEQVRDVVGAMLVQGTGVTIVVDDAGDTVTISSSAPAPMTTEQVQDIVAAMLLEGTGVDLVYDDAAGTLTLTATGGGGGGATTLDGLTDVYTPSPGDGYVLTYDAATSQWVPRPGGGAVGSWVSNRTVTYTLPAFAETDLTAAPLSVPPSNAPTTAQIAFTVTAPMLVTASDSGEAEPFGHATCIIVNFSIDNRLGGNTSLACEAKVNGVQVGIATATGHTNAQRGGGAVFLRDMKVGDTVEVRVWNTAAVTSKLDWWGRSAVPIRFGNKLPPGGGRYQFRDVNILGRVPQPAPATVLTWLPTWTQDVGNDDVTYDLGAQISTQAPDVARTYVNHPDTGVLSGFRMENQSNSILLMRSSTGAPIVEHNSFGQVRADRLAIPTPPA